MCSVNHPLPPLPKSCPFTIRRLNSTTHVIREHDEYGEYPNIYAKTIPIDHPICDSITVLSDTGCGTQVDNASHDPDDASKGPKIWDMSTFLTFTLHDRGRLKSPLLIITTHCHYDHILGLHSLLAADSSHHHHDHGNKPPTTILSSAHAPTFTTPYANLQRNSLCAPLDLTAPHYSTNIWARHGERVYLPIAHPDHPTQIIDTGVMILHTPGHTPDSLSWYDESDRHLSVGDMFYARESPDTRNPGENGEGGVWDREPPMPTIFCADSDLFLWWRALQMLIAFVTDDERWEVNEDSPGSCRWSGRSGVAERSDEPDGTDGLEWVKVRRFENPWGEKEEITLSAAHVTTCTPALEALCGIREFMVRVLNDAVPFADLGMERGERVGLWDDALSESDGGERRAKDDGGSGSADGDRGAGRDSENLTFSVKAPLRIVEEGRRGIRREEWSRG